MDSRAKFAFVAAGLKLRAFGGMGCFIKYHPRTAETFRVIEQSKHHVWVDTQDRELFLTDQTMFAQGHYPTGFDTFTNLSHLHTVPGRDLGLDYVMLNYTDHHKNTEMGIRPVSALGRGTGVVVDSGGFQIVKGDLDWVDPEAEIGWYNRNADLGMLLDVPTTHPEWVTRAAHVQRAVIDMWVEQKRPDLELINIVHGEGDDLQRYLDIVDVPSIRRLAFGGMFFLSFMATIDKVVRYLIATPDFKHHHILGVTHRGLMMMLMYMSKRGLSPLITCDSSSALQLSCYRTLYTYARMEESLSMCDLGAKGNYLAGRARLPCCCPVCSTLVYADCFRHLRGDIADALVCMHNVYTMNDWTQHTNYMIQTEDKQVIKDSIDQQFRVGYGAQQVKMFQAGLDYIDYAIEHGADKARKRFDMWFPRQSKLFATKTLGIDGGDEVFEEPLSHTEVVLDKFERYFGIGG